jgi:hypothetical protein
MRRGRGGETRDRIFGRERIEDREVLQKVSGLCIQANVRFGEEVQRSSVLVISEQTVTATVQEQSHRGGFPRGTCIMESGESRAGLKVQQRTRGDEDSGNLHEAHGRCVVEGVVSILTEE